MNEFTIRPLTPDLLDDYLAFFDADAFTDNPEWAPCYCAYYHVYTPATEAAWEVRTAAENRAVASDLIRAGRMHGYLAYAGDKPVGWCHAAPRLELPNLETIPAWRVSDPQRAGSIVCFIVAPGHRHRGIARRLLDAACDGFRRQGLDYAEAYPRATAASDADNCHGPLGMYLAAGFAPLPGQTDNRILRKDLTGRSESRPSPLPD